MVMVFSLPLLLGKDSELQLELLPSVSRSPFTCEKGTVASHGGSKVSERSCRSSSLLGTQRGDKSTGGNPWIEILFFVCKICKASLPVELLAIYVTGSRLHGASLAVGKWICAESHVILGVGCYSRFLAFVNVSKCYSRFLAFEGRHMA